MSNIKTRLAKLEQETASLKEQNKLTCLVGYSGDPKEMREFWQRWHDEHGRKPDFTVQIISAGPDSDNLDLSMMEYEYFFPD
jgi:hypothetical protein